MTWQVFSRPEAANDVIEIADWYDTRVEGLGDRFIDEFLVVLDALTRNPLLHSDVILARTSDGAIRKVFHTE